MAVGIVDDQKDSHGRSGSRGRGRGGRDGDGRRHHDGGGLNETARKGGNRVWRVEETEAAAGVAWVRPRTDLLRGREDGIAGCVDHGDDRGRVGCPRTVRAEVVEVELARRPRAVGDGRNLVQV